MATSTSHRPEAPLLVALRDMGKAIAAARDALAFETDPQVLGDGICELVGLGAEIDALRTSFVAQCEANGVPDTIEVRTVGQYVAARTNAPAKGVNLDSRLARWLREFPIFAHARETRALTTQHLEILRLKVDNDRTRTLLRDDQDFFVDLAPQVGFRQFERACQYWLIANDPDGEEPVDQLESAAATISVGGGGRTTITITSDAVHGHAITRMIEQEAAKIRKEDAARGIERTIRQRRHAAVFALMERGFRREDGSHPIPLINLVMSEQVAEWAVAKVAQMADPDYEPEFGETVPVHPLDVDGRCEFIDGQPVHPLLVASVLGLDRFDIPTLRRYVMTAKSRIIDYSYNTRIAPEHLRTATHIEHRGECVIPGCDAPHSWLQADHIAPHADGGPTSLRNTEPKCEADNLAKGAQTGHIPWIDRPPPPRYRPRGSPSEDDEPDDRSNRDPR